MPPGSTRWWCPRTSPPTSGPRSRKVACGAAEAVPFVRVTNLSRTLKALKERGVWLYGTAGDAENSCYTTADFTASMALVMGAEGTGLRRLTREQCDHLVRLPMAGSVSSFNVSVATGICLFEAVRQRMAPERAVGLSQSCRGFRNYSAQTGWRF